jgi:hypothetical protein
MFDAKPLQIGFVLLQSADGFIAFHGNIIANPSGCFHVFRFRRARWVRGARLNSFSLLVSISNGSAAWCRDAWIEL